jgi:hypothetical protein
LLPVAKAKKDENGFVLFLELCAVPLPNVVAFDRPPSTPPTSLAFGFIQDKVKQQPKLNNYFIAIVQRRNVEFNPIF